jgi:hypothetical protein
MAARARDVVERFCVVAGPVMSSGQIALTIGHRNRGIWSNHRSRLREMNNYRSLAVPTLAALFCILLTACGPSKETMCDRISQTADTKNEQDERYIKCLNADREWVKKTYDDLQAGRIH